MSSVIWSCIREDNDEAVQYLTEIETSPLSTARGFDVSDADYVCQLKSTLIEVEFRETSLRNLIDSLSAQSSSLYSTRAAMTGKEREAEDAEFAQFSKTIPFANTLRRLKTEMRNVRRVQADIQKIMNEQFPPNPVPSSTSIASNSAPPDQSFSLPILQLPTFSGNSSEWLSFWDRFRYAVHDVDPKRLPPVIKLSHLLNCLKGPALEVVNGLPICDGSYTTAIDLLTAQFGNPDTNIKQLYGQLEVLVCNGRDNSGLQKFSNELERTLSQLEHLGEDISSYNLYLSIVKKLPHYLLKELVHEEKSTPRDELLKKLRQRIRNTIQEREEVDVLSRRFVGLSKPPRPADPSPRPQQFGPNPFQSGQNQFRRPSFNQVREPTSSLTFSTTVRKLPCLFCSSSNHNSPWCDKVSTYESRVNSLRQARRCVKCARPGHSSTECHQSTYCSQCRKNGHLALLCPSRCRSSSNAVAIPPKPLAIGANQPQQSSVTVEASTNVNNSTAKRTVLLKCIEVDVINPSNPSRRASALAMFDDGSTTSYVSTSLADKLQLDRIHSTVLSYGVFGDPLTRNVTSDVVSLSIVSKSNVEIPMSAQSLKFLSRPVPHAVVNSLDEVDFPVVQHRSPDILIGMDFYNDFAVRHHSDLASGLSLFSSKIGFILGGCSQSISRFDHVSTNTAITLFSSQTIEDQVSKYFSIESIGIDDSLSKSHSLSTFQDSVQFNGNRYEVKLPWNQIPPKLPDNFGLSLGRLRSTIRSLRKSSDLIQKYDAIIKEQVQLGIIEEVRHPRQQLPDRPVHYLPHQPVIREDKGKVRIVYDASAKCSRHLKSLNDCLDPGPVLLENLVGVLLRFRLPPIVVACDIEKAFLQVEISEPDRDATRFLWLRDLNLDDAPSNLITFRFKRVPFGLTCSPFLLAATLITHFQNNSSLIASEILRNLYVDNVLLSGDSVSEVQRKCDQAKAAFSSIGMNLREFASNVPDAICHLDESDRLRGHEQKFLGLKWNLQSDSITLQLPQPDGLIVSKRLVLSSIAANFDPLGLLSPALVTAKLFFQRLWQQTFGWDDELTDDLKSEWQEISESWRPFLVSVPRKSAVDSASNWSLHAFTDASQHAFACCIFLVTENGHGQKQSHLVFAKSKVRPTRFKSEFSIHRMELLGVVIGARAIVFVHEQLSRANPGIVISPTLNLWTDSSTVLHWLRSTGKLEVFVQNRVDAIRKVANLCCRYVSTSCNPADVASRGCTVSELIDDQQWWHGPDWLTSSSWPDSDIPSFDSNASIQSTAAEVTFNVVQVESLVDVNRFSSFDKLVRCVAYVFRFLRRLGRLPQHFHSSDQFPSRLLSVDERRKAELLVLLEAQRVFPPSEAERANLKLYEDDQHLLRSAGRIEKSSVTRFTQDPIYLPRRSPVTRLLIFREHRQSLHGGSLLTLSQLRRRFWIPQGRRSVLSAIRSCCMVCRRFNAEPFRVPEPPPLPAERVRHSAPFEFTGVDYFGPLNVKSGKRIHKVWVSLFTCMAVRAIHLEVVNDLSTAGFLLAFKRFVARRGLPRKIWSDNGTQFGLAAKTLDARLRLDFDEKQPTVSYEEYLAQHGVQWSFITECAPWKGGFYERLVGITKHHLRRSLQRELLQLDQFTTLLIEIESVVNLRPITFLSDNVGNSSPLRPIDFLSMNKEFRQIEPHPFVHVRLTPNPSSQRQLLYLWEEFSQRLDSFWCEWTRDYLLALRERQRRIRNSGVDRVPEPGEVVLLFDGSLSRSKWKTAVVVQPEPREDGVVRTVSVRLPTGNIVHRAVSHLFPLEATLEH